MNVKLFLSITQSQPEYEQTQAVKGMRDYLTVLSVGETRRFKGVSFLDFLRFGETGVDAFMDGKIG